MTTELEVLFKKMSEEEELTKKLTSAESPEHAQSIAAEYGIVLTIEQVLEAKQILEKALSAKMGELTDEDLEGVSGGRRTAAGRAVGLVVDRVIGFGGVVGGGVVDAGKAFINIFAGW